MEYFFNMSLKKSFSYNLDTPLKQTVSPLKRGPGGSRRRFQGIEEYINKLDAKIKEKEQLEVVQIYV